MEFLEIALRLALAGVLLVSGVAKLFDREGSEAAMRGFRVPDRLVPAGTVLLPWVELALAVGLLMAPITLWAAPLTAALFAVFTIAVVLVARRGEEVDCHCFGQLDSAPVSWWTVARNTVLTAAAAWVWWLVETNGAVSIAEKVVWWHLYSIAALVLFAAGVFLMLQIWQAIERQTLQMGSQQHVANPPAKESGTPGQAYAQLSRGMVLVDHRGVQHSAPLLHTRKSPTVLIFVSQTCAPCLQMLPDIPTWQAEYAGRVRIHVIGFGDRASLAELADTHGIERMYFQESGDLAAAFGVQAFPSAVLVERDAFVRLPVAAGASGIRRLLTTATEIA